MRTTSIAQMPRKSRDARVPTSVTQCGKVTVRVFDEEEYRANIAQYYGTDESSKPARPGRTYKPYEKRKPASKYDWTASLKRVG